MDDKLENHETWMLTNDSVRNSSHSRFKFITRSPWTLLNSRIPYSQRCTEEITYRCGLWNIPGVISQLRSPRTWCCIIRGSSPGHLGWALRSVSVVSPAWKLTKPTNTVRSKCDVELHLTKVLECGALNCLSISDKFLSHLYKPIQIFGPPDRGRKTG
jgi:hypothetical protein